MGFNTIERELKPILERNINARCDDMLLYYIYVKSKGADFLNIWDRDYRHLFNVSPYETISRIRRKLQEKYEELRPTPAQIEEKKRAEKEYKEYARKGYTRGAAYPWIRSGSNDK